MLDVREELVTALETIGITVRYELFYDSETPIPCITYIEYKNSEEKKGDTFGYSKIGYTVTVWSNTVDDNVHYSKLVDKKMRQLGYWRRNSNEMIQGNLIRNVLDYEGTGREIY